VLEATPLVEDYELPACKVLEATPLIEDYELPSALRCETPLIKDYEEPSPLTQPPILFF
jgi:hypothetical protein